MKRFDIQGKVLNSTMLPISDAIVSIVQSTQDIPDIAAFTDEHGEFAYFDLLPGTYMFRAENEWVSQTRTVKITNTNIYLEIILDGN
ncbi:MAG: hypothetical protein AAF502_23340 [Bacteroidota bacterium]